MQSSAEQSIKNYWLANTGLNAIGIKYIIDYFRSKKPESVKIEKHQ